MKIKPLLFFTLMLLLPLLSLAQKAYDNVAYRGKLNNRTVYLTLANGYIGASAIKFTKPKVMKFVPEVNAVGEDGKLKFVPSKATGNSPSKYFLLEGMSEAFETLPNALKGIYYLKGKHLNVTFYKLHKSA